MQQFVQCKALVDAHKVFFWEHEHKRVRGASQVVVDWLRQHWSRSDSWTCGVQFLREVTANKHAHAHHPVAFWGKPANKQTNKQRASVSSKHHDAGLLHTSVSFKRQKQGPFWTSIPLFVSQLMEGEWGAKGSGGTRAQTNTQTTLVSLCRCAHSHSKDLFYPSAVKVLSLSATKKKRTETKTRKEDSMIPHMLIPVSPTTFLSFPRDFLPKQAPWPFRRSIGGKGQEARPFWSCEIKSKSRGQSQSVALNPPLNGKLSICSSDVCAHTLCFPFISRKQFGSQIYNSVHR